MQHYIYKSYEDTTEIKKSGGGFKKIIAVVAVSLLTVILLLFLAVKFIAPAVQYGKAMAAFGSGDYTAAADMFLDLGDWRDSPVHVDACYVSIGLEMLSDENLGAALTYYELLSAPYSVFAEEMRNSFYSYAERQIESGNVDTALSLLSGVLSGHGDSDRRYSELRFDLGSALLEQADYPSAYEHLKVVDRSFVPGAAEALASCRRLYYDALVQEFEEKRAAESQFNEKIYIPEGFSHEMFDGYPEAENYRIYSRLVDSGWGKSEHADNLALVYQLGDFLNTAEKGFAMQRLYGRRYSNETGGYFEIGEDGTAISNLPRYWLSGYYGLYSKIEDGIYYIGSDEVKWTKQFEFTFADNDKTLWVYCHSTGYRYMLTLEA